MGKPGFVEYCTEHMEKVKKHGVHGSHVEVIGDVVFDIKVDSLPGSVTKDSLKALVKEAENSTEPLNEAIHHLNVTETTTSYEDSNHANRLITELEVARGSTGKGECYDHSTNSTVEPGTFKTVAADEDGDTEVQKEVKEYERSCFCVEMKWLCDESKAVDDARIRKDEHDRHTTTMTPHVDDATEAHHVDDATEAHHVADATEAHHVDEASVSPAESGAEAADGAPAVDGAAVADIAAAEAAAADSVPSEEATI